MIIALYGIGGTYNFGCEAIVRGTERIIHTAYPDAVIDYYSYDYINDKNRISSDNVNIIPIYKRSAKRFIDKLLIKIGCHNLSLSLKFSWVKKYDYVLSIGGDIYTLPPLNELTDDGTYTNSLLEFGKYCNSKKTKLVIWGASVGPFDANPILKKVFFEHFHSCITHIVVREHFSETYLKDNKYNKVSFYCDPAFVVESENHKTLIAKENAIGINLSPLSNMYVGCNEKMDLVINTQAETIAEVARRFGKKIILLPHVISSNINDDDLSYLKQIEVLLKKMGVDTELVECNSFCNIKHEIGKCDFIVSARMHCAINALACGVPAFFLSYSQKSRAMCNVVYQTDKFAVPLESFNNKEKFASFLEKAVPELQNYCFDEIIPSIQQSSYSAARIFEQI